MRTSNPVMRSEAFQPAYGGTETMTIRGSVAKTALFLALASGLGLVTFLIARNGINVMPLVIVGGIGGLILAIVTAFKPAWAAITGTLYALAEGLVLGGISAYYESRYPGVAFTAAGCTVGTLAALLLAYQSGWIRATQGFRLGVTAATGGIFLFYLVSMVLRLFGIDVPFIHQSGLLGIGFSLVVVTVAALNLVLDFDFIEQGAAQGAPKHMEWYAAFGLMVTLIWLYLEILRLLAKISGRRD